MKEIPLTKGFVAKVDDGDYESLSEHKWHVKQYKTGNVYAARMDRDANGKRLTVLMHIEITGQKGMDHADGDGLNNQRLNLRPASRSQNGMNKRKVKLTSSKYKGVMWYPRYGVYYAYIKDDGKRIHIGQFGQDEVAAAKAYDKEALTRFGQFARLNFSN